MSFTQDWDATLPVDHTLISQGPSKIRNVRVDVADRLATIISGFVSGETVLGVLKIPFIAQSTPSTVTDQIQLYGKAVGGKTELHTLDEDGNEKQITLAAGPSGLNITAAQIIALVGPSIMPVGFVVTLGVSTDPATLFGFGTWTAIAGKVIVGIDAGQTEFDTLDETGGSKTHTLSIGEIPAHDHTVTMYQAGGGENLEGTQSSTPNATQTTSSTGGGGAHNNLQPYIVKYVWQRTA